jgi:hypothetical protein
VSEDIWVTRDGRELKLSEMFPGHIGNAQVVLRKWIKQERDPEMRQELKGWLRRFAKEQRVRVKAWRTKHALERGKGLA